MFQYLNGMQNERGDKMKIKLKFTWKIWILIIVVSLSLLSIFITPNFLQKGVLITSVASNSTAFEQGFRQGQVITEIDGQKVTSIEDFSKILQNKYPPIASNESEPVKVIFKTADAEIIIFSAQAPNITVSRIKNTNIKLGLDLEGGSRALIKAENTKLTQTGANDLAEVIKNRLNVYGIEDMKIDPVSDLSGEYYIKIEIAGATPSDLENLISQQGKFEAKIGNETVFIGGEKDITSVARSGQDVEITCPSENVCNFRFGIYLSEAAAKRHAEVTKDLESNVSNPGYLSEKLDLYLDDKLVDSLLISEDLKGRVTTQVQIQGSGSGETKEEAYKDAEASMHKLQTILITGSLPYKLEIVKLDTISPTLGEEFMKSIFIAGLIALFAVAIIVFVRYRKIKSSIALLIVSISEIIIILGIASFIRWNLDLPSIAGILAAIGTGVDDQIIILDESLRGKILSIKQRIKRAFSIIMGAYFTAIVALIPLFWASAGFFKGFAVTTLIGVTIGVLITRPAFSDMIRKIEERN